MRVVMRSTRFDRCSWPAVLAVLEHGLAPQRVQACFASSLDDVRNGDLVLFSFASSMAETVRAEMDALRARLGDALLSFAGGPHPSADPDGVLAMGFRWVCVGEAGPSFVSVVRSLLDGILPAPGALHDPPEELDRYPAWPAHTGLFAPVEISRGCPHACAYCQTPSLFGRRMRHRSVEMLESTLRRGVDAGHRYTRFISPNAFAYGSSDGRTPDLSAVRRLLEAARRSGMSGVFLGTFPSEVRPESVSDELLCLVRDLCDNRSIAVGLQSGSDRVLRDLRRGHTAGQGREAIARIASRGFEPRVDFIFGLPGETDSDRTATREMIDLLASEYGARVHLHRFVPLPGTPLAGHPPAPLDPVTEKWIADQVGMGRVAGVKRRAPWTRIVRSSNWREMRLAPGTGRD